MEFDVENVSAEIARTVTLIMNPLTIPEERIVAHQKLEEFRDNSPISAKCGFFLSKKANQPFIRHCGFQLIDHYVKLHWNVISVEEKLWIKDCILETIASGTETVTKEELYVKDAISRIVVELIKREWPQQWPSLMDELHNLCCMGDEQTELVLLVFSRLADDIVQFQNVPDKRRREIYRTLCTHLNDLFTFFWRTLSEKTEKYFESKQMGHSNEEVVRHCRVAQVTLETLTSFVEWVPINYILENSPLCGLLSKLLEFEELRMYAGTCLLSIFERKGKPEERRQLLVFFEETNIFSVISALDVYDERHYLFLKLLLQCLNTLGLNLTFSIVQFDTAEPENFSLYLNCVLLFTKHPSLTLSNIAHCIWLNILRNPQLSSSPLIHSMIPTLLKHEALKLVKSGYPSKNDSVACKFSAAEYDSDEEFESYYCRLRSDIAEILKLITKSHPKTAFTFVSLLIKTLFNNHDWSAILDCSTTSIDLHKCWDASVIYMDAVCGTLWKNVHTPEVEELTKEGLELLDQAINFTTEDLAILSYALSSVSSLFFFITFAPEVRTIAIEKIFSNLTSCKLDGPCVKDSQNLRRHASALMIKLSCNHPSILLPEFENISSRIESLFPTSEYLTQFDKCALLESLMILSNNFYDYDKQSNFLKIALSSIESIWFSPTVKNALTSTEAFVSFIGLDKPHQENDISPITKNASDLNLSMNVIKACVKRCVCPSDPEVAKKGNYLHPLSATFDMVLYQNPSAQYIVPMLDNVFLIIRLLNTLYIPETLQLFDPSYTNPSVLEIGEGDKNTILGCSYVNNSQQQKGATDRMKYFIQGFYDGCLHILGGAVENLFIDFYTIPNLPSLLKESLLHKVEYLPPMQLRSLIRLFIRPFFLWCPLKAHDELMTVLAGLCPFMLQKLNSTWDKFKARFGNCINYEEQLSEIQEALDDQLNRMLSREYLSFLGDLLVKQCSSYKTEDTMEDDHKEPASYQPKALTPLGFKIIGTESVRAVLICTAFDSLRWLDTVSNIKALQLCELLFSQMIADGQVQQIQEANYLLQSVLYAIQELGEHETNLALMLSFGVNVYENLRTRFPDLTMTLLQSVDCDQFSLQKLDEAIVRNALKTKNDKAKKEAFKHVVGNIIGRSIGEQHKRDVCIKNLPPLLQFKPKEDSSLLDVAVNDDIGLCSLFNPTSKTT